MVLSKSSRRASSSRNTPVVIRMEAEDSDFQESNNPATRTSSSTDDSDDDVIQYLHSNPRVSEAEFNQCSSKRPTNITLLQKKKMHYLINDNHSTDENESMAHEHQGIISGIATRTRSRERRNKHNAAVIAKSTPSDSTESTEEYCSFSESDDSDDPDYESGSCLRSQRMGVKGEKHTTTSECVVKRLQDEDPSVVEHVHQGPVAGKARKYEKKLAIQVDPVVERVHQGPVGRKKEKQHMARSEWVVESHEDTRERKKKSAIKVDPVVELVHQGPVGREEGKYAGRRPVGRPSKKKSAMEAEHVVELVHQGPLGGEKGKKHMARSEWVVESHEDTTLRKKKSAIKLDPVVELVHQGPVGRPYKKKSVIEAEHVVELVHQGPLGGEKEKKHMARTEWVVEPHEDTAIKVDPVVELLHHGPVGGKEPKYAGRGTIGGVHKKKYPGVELVHQGPVGGKEGKYVGPQPIGGVHKKKSTLEVDPVVEVVYQGLMMDGKGVKYASRGQMGGMCKKHMARPESTVERVQEPMRGERETLVRKRVVSQAEKIVNKHTTKKIGEKRAEERHKSVGKYKVVTEQVHQEPSPNMEHPNGEKRRKSVGKRKVVTEQVHQEPSPNMDNPNGEKRHKSVGKREVVTEQVQQEPSPNMEHPNADIGVNSSHEMPDSSPHFHEEKEQVQVHREPSPNMKHMNGDIGVNSSHEMPDSSSPFQEEKEQVHETDQENKKDEQVMDESVEKLAKQSNCDSPVELRRLLLDSLLNESPDIVVDKSSKPEFKLPLKFSFDDGDEIPKPKEKTEYEIEMQNMYAEMNNYFTLEEARSLCQQEVREDIAESSHNGRCKEHDYGEDDAIGMVCRICQHVGLEAKHIQLPWAEKPSRRAGKRKFPSESERPREECIRFTPGESSRAAVFLNPGEGTVWDIKPGVRETMYKHQQEGFEFLWKNMAGSIDLSEIKSSCSDEFGGCIISHAPGTGKTRLTMMFVETYLKLFPDCRSVIIAPSSLLLTWEGEFRKWKVEFPFHNLNNPEVSVKEHELAQRLSNKKVPNIEDIRLVKICSWKKEQSVLGMSYNLFVKLVGEKRPTKKSVKEEEPDPELKKTLLEKPGLVVLDEGHIPRNQTSSIWNAVLKLATEKRVVLSGTPFQNNFRELFNVMQVARPSFAIRLKTDPRFSEMISKNKKKMETMEQKEVDKAILELKTAMAPYVHMYNDSSFLESKLPGLRDFLIILKPTALQKRIIEEMEMDKGTFELEAKVASVSVHPSLLEPSEKEKLLFDEAELNESRSKPDEGVKTRFLMELVRISTDRNEKGLVFSQYIKPLLLLQDHLCKGFNWGEDQVLMIKGEMDQKQRQKLMTSFNNPNDESKILLASTKCCSEGVSLVGASRVVMLDVVWNPAVERQAISRAYRIGQTKIVYTYHLMASGTSEMQKYRQQAKKDRLSEMVFAASSAGTPKLSHTDEGIEDIVLEKMVANAAFQQIFDKITYQPKQRNE